VSGFETEFWHWYSFAVLLLVFEVFAPGAVFIFFACGALLVGTLLLLYPDMTVAIQAIIFAISSVAGMALWWYYRKDKADVETDSPLLNKRNEALIGREFTLITAITEGVGRIKTGDSQWRVVGEDAEKGAKVRVVSVDGATLKVVLI